MMQDMVGYGFQKISDAFKVYWYMFAYAYLAPALCFILAGLIMLYGLYFNNGVISSIG
jgi:GTP-binding protein EngB required for normal cell division